MTGTEVHWVRSENDKMAKWGAEIAAKTVAKHGVSFEWRWREACRDRPQTCPAHNRESKSVQWDRIEDNPGTLGHDRMAYYALMKNKIIKGSPHSLLAAQTASIEVEANRIENAALQEALGLARWLVAQAREQVEIAHRDHDERLKNTYTDLAQRFCARPGSVSQAELDALPKPYGRSVYNTPPNLQGCEATIYLAISHGVKAEAFMGQFPVPLNGHRPLVQPVRPLPPGPVALNPYINFSSNLPTLKNLAANACSSSGRVEVNTYLFNPRNPYHFSKDRDDEIIAELSANLGDCSRQLFNKFVEMIRAGQGTSVNSQWVRDRVNSYSSRPIYVDPPRTLPRRGGRCEDYGNIRCP